MYSASQDLKLRNSEWLKAEGERFYPPPMWCQLVTINDGGVIVMDAAECHIEYLAVVMTETLWCCSMNGVALPTFASSIYFIVA